MVDTFIKDICWLAGLLEGEGCFNIGRQHGQNGKIYKQVKISLAMTDRDTIERAAHIMGTNLYTPRELPSGKTMYKTAVHGPKCMGIMMTIYGLMSQRRQRKIRECIDVWKANPGPSHHVRRGV